MNNHLVQIGELIPIKGIWFQVIDASGQVAGYPERIVLRPHSPTISGIKKEIKEFKRSMQGGKKKGSQYGPPASWQEKAK